MVAAIIKSELETAGEEPIRLPWLTETAAQGGQAVWRFSLTSVALILGSAAEKPVQCLFFAMLFRWHGSSYGWRVEFTLRKSSIILFQYFTILICSSRVKTFLFATSVGLPPNITG